MNFLMYLTRSCGDGAESEEGSEEKEGELDMGDG